MDSDSNRREFLTTSMAAGACVALASELGAQSVSDRPSVASDSSRLHIKPRYHRWHVDPGVEWVESNTGYAHLDWSIPLKQAALVLVDVWDHHYLLDTEARAEAVIADKLVPLLAACRKAGLPIIHAPSPPQANQHPNRVTFATDAGSTSTSTSTPGPKVESWPPSAFRGKVGPYQAYRRPAEAREPELTRLRAGLKIHPKVQPMGGEPVVATGEELHRYCQQEGILFLLFAGFNTNACILVRDYGTLAMSQRGYEVVVVRDGTTGMESAESKPTLSQTRGAILFLEMFGQYSIAADEVIAGLAADA